MMEGRPVRSRFASNPCSGIRSVGVRSPFEAVWSILLVVILGIPVGCVTPWIDSTPPLPKLHTLVREQLVVHSDFRLPQKHRLIEDLVRQRDEVAMILELPRSDEPIHVYLFEDPLRFQAHLARSYPGLPPRRALFIKNDTQLIVLAHWGERVAEDLRHEVAHGYLHAVVPGIPLWLDEGLAEYFEVPRGEQGLNIPHLELLGQRYRRSGWEPQLERLESLTDLAELQQLDYAEAWLWPHFLLETTPARRTLLQSHLARLRESALAPPLAGELRALHADYHRDVRDHLEQLIAPPRNSETSLPVPKSPLTEPAAGSGVD